MTAATPLRPVDASPPDPPARRVNRPRLIVMITAGVVLVAVFATWLIAFSSVFGVRTITVRGTRLLTVAQVRAAAHLAPGTPLVRVDTSAVARRVEQLPDVASAQVSTSFPSTVVITVDEREPVGYLRSRNGVMLVDATGTQYRTVSKAPRGLPHFVLPSGAQARAAGAAVATVAAALPASLRRDVESITALSPQTITLLLVHGQVVQWGSADRSAEKALLLPALLRLHAAQIDLTNPDQPFTRSSA